MKRKNLFFYFLLIFLIAFILLGQTEYLQKYWMVMGIGIAPFILFFLLDSQRKNNDFLDQRASLHWIALAVYMIHQFEEHGIDLYGHTYSFILFFNHQFSSFVGCTDTINCPLNPESIFYINTLLVWWPFILAIYKARSSAIVGSFSVALILSNALMHIMPALIHGAYNPGLLTSLLLFLPFSFFYYRTCFIHGTMTKPIFILSLLYGVLSHGFLISIVILFHAYSQLPPILFPLAFAIYSLFPLWVDRFFPLRPNER